MNEHPGNPATNKLMAGISDEDLLSAIRASGYPLQSTVVDQIVNAAAKVLEGLNSSPNTLRTRLRCQEEWPYVDSDSQDIRTLDAFVNIDITDEESRKPRAETVTETLYFSVDLLMECKQSELPYVFFMRPVRCGDVPRLSGLPNEQIAMKVAESSVSIRIRVHDAIAAADVELAQAPPTAISMSKAHRQGKSLVLSGEDTFKSISLPLSKAIRYHHGLTRSAEPKLYNHIRLVLPIAVLRAPMIGVNVDGGEISIAALPWVRLVRVDPAAEMRHHEFAESTAIDVVHADYLDRYITTALESCIQVKHRLLKLAIPLLSGEAAISSSDSRRVYIGSAGRRDGEGDENAIPIFDALKPRVSDEEFMADWNERFRIVHSRADDNNVTRTATP